MASFRASARAIAILLLLCLLLPPAILFAVLGLSSVKHRIIQFFHRGVATLWEVQIAKHSGEFMDGPVLILSNHSTYLDVIVLAALSPMIFTPKSEIAGWPLVGWLCKFCDVVFIERKASRAGAFKDILRKELEAGERLCLFPEGTTGTGETLLPFKSSFLAIAETAIDGKEVPVQPVVLAYTHLDGKRIPPAERETVAWVGEAAFFPHLWQMLGKRTLRVAVSCLPPMYHSQYGDRKQLAKAVQDRMENELKTLLQE